MINLASIENRILQAAENLPAHLQRQVAVMNNKRAKVRMRSYCKDNGIRMDGAVSILTDVGPVEFVPKYRCDPKKVLSELKRRKVMQERRRDG